MNIQYAVSELIKKKPFLEDALLRGLINNAALAEFLIPDIEKYLAKKVKFSAVNMAIRRHAQKELKHVKKIEFGKNFDIVMRSNLVEIDYPKSDKLLEILKTLYNLINIDEGGYLTITQGAYDIMIISNSKYGKEIKEKLSEFKVKHSFKNLCAITLTAPVEVLEIPGVFFRITRALMWKNISIVQIISTSTDMTFIFNEKDATGAYDTLRDLLVVDKDNLNNNAKEKTTIN